MTHGQFGENFTVEGLPDDEVCIGDRYRIGTVLLVQHHRPGCYFKVLQEGEVQAGDEIVKVAEGPERLTVAEVDGLLYLPGHAPDRIKRAHPGSQPRLAGLLPGDG